jgi:hypothetical protein
VATGVTLRDICCIRISQQLPPNAIAFNDGLFRDVLLVMLHPWVGKGGLKLRLIEPLASGSQSRSPVTRYEVGVHMCGHTT